MNEESPFRTGVWRLVDAFSASDYEALGVCDYQEEESMASSRCDRVGRVVIGVGREVR
jgi:hypothetical protein